MLCAREASPPTHTHPPPLTPTALAVSSALTVGGFSFILLGTAYAFGVTSPQDATNRLRVWVPAQRRRLLGWMGLKDEPIFKPKAPTLTEGGLTPEQEWDGWVEEGKREIAERARAREERKRLREAARAGASGARERRGEAGGGRGGGGGGEGPGD